MAQPPDMTIKEWCAKRNLSIPTYYNLKKKGLAPETIELPGLRTTVRITAKADAAWEKMMVRRKQQAAAKREAKRRVDQTTMLGRLALKSPLHPANRGHGRAVRKEPSKPPEPKPKPPNRTAPSPSRKRKFPQAAE